jgi:hypothetical protein
MAEHAPLTTLQLAVLTDEDSTLVIRERAGIPHGVYRSLRIRGLIYRVGNRHRLTADGAAAVAAIKAGRARLDAERLADRSRMLAARMRAGCLEAAE